MIRATSIRSRARGVPIAGQRRRRRAATPGDLVDEAMPKKCRSCRLYHRHDDRRRADQFAPDGGALREASG